MGKILKSFKPHVDFRGTSAFASKDVLFDWTPMELPKGGAVELKSISYMVRGTDTSIGNGGLDFRLLFAKPIDSGIPPSLSISNLTITAAEAAAVRPYLIGTVFMNAGEMEDSNDTFVNYNFGSTAGYASSELSFAQNYASGSSETFTHPARNFSPIILEGGHYSGGEIASALAVNHTYPATTSGNQTIFVAGIALGAFNFGTGVLLNDADDQAISTTSVGLVTDGTDADDIFAIGDEVAVGTGGGDVSIVGDVTAVAANLLTVDRVDVAISDDDELFFVRPIQFNFGFEY
jgi:hypothetical protein|tara:strand:- start:54 stop:926 length:873 start_codon:yes stop_codon:yes gene_type:complete